MENEESVMNLFEKKEMIRIVKKNDYSEKYSPISSDEFLKAERIESTKLSFFEAVKVDERSESSCSTEKRFEEFNDDHRGRKSGSGSSIKSVFERRIDRMEKLLEDRVEKVLEDRFEKMPWLQPIEAWIGERCRSESRGYDSDSELRKNPEGKIERRIIEHLKSLRARHEKVQQKRVRDPDGIKVEAGFKIRESNSDNKLFDKKFMENFKGSSKSGGSSPVALKRSRIVVDNLSDNFSSRLIHSSERNFKNSRSSSPSSSSKVSKNFLTSNDGAAIDKEEELNIVQDPDLDNQTSYTLNTVENKHNQTHDFIDKIREGFKEKREELHRVENN